MSALHTEVKQMIIEALSLEDLRPEDIAEDAPLFSDEGIGLDSIDALELGLALKKRYGIKLKEDSEETRQHFYSVNTLAALIESQQTS